MAIKQKVERTKQNLTNEELVWMFQAGNEEAFNELIERNAGAIHRQINQAAAHGAFSVGFDRDDALQTALLALCQCAKKYNPRYKVKFTTYAWGNISSLIMNESYERKYTVRVPRNILNEMRGYINAVESESESGEESGVVKAFLEKADHDAETFDEYINQYSKIVSLNNQIDTDRGTEGIDTIPDDRFATEMASRSQRLVIEDAIAASKLTPQQREIIEKMFGLYGETASAEQLAKQYGCTRQWVNVLKQKALEELKKTLSNSGLDLTDLMR